jgi:hypothetical protein
LLDQQLTAFSRAECGKLPHCPVGDSGIKSAVSHNQELN